MRHNYWWFLLTALAALAGLLWVLARPSAPPRQPASRPPPIPIKPDEARRRWLSGEKIILLDVRTPEENAEKRIPGSLLLPLEEAPAFGAKAQKLIPDKDTAVFIYCRSGRRSRLAGDILAGFGYRNLHDLGGIIDWPFETE